MFCQLERVEKHRFLQDEADLLPQRSLLESPTSTPSIFTVPESRIVEAGIRLMMLVLPAQ